MTIILLATTSLPPLWANAQTEHLTWDQVDSIVQKLPTLPDDTVKAYALAQICSNHPNADTTLKYAQELYSLSLKVGARWLGLAYRYMTWYCQTAGDFESALKYSYEALRINDSLGLKYEMAMNYNALGESIENLGDHSSASEYFHKALDLLISINNTSTITYTYRNLGIIFINYKLFDEAKIYFNEALKIDKNNNDIRQTAMDYYYLAQTELNFHEQHKDTASIYEAKRLIDLAGTMLHQTDAEFNIMHSDLCQMQTYVEYSKLHKQPAKQRLLDSSMIFYNEALSIADKNGLLEGYEFIFDLHKAKYLLATKQYAECKKTLTRIERKANNDINNLEGYLLDIYSGLIELCTATNDYKKAIEYQEKLTYIQKRHYDNEFAANSIKLSAKDEFDIEMRNRDIEAQKQKIVFEEHKNQMHIIAGTICLFILLLMGFAINIYRNNRRRHNTNIALMRQRENYKLQRSMLANANYEATSGIMYAKEIHTAIMPTPEIMESIFGETLIIWNPIEIISGDFFWAKQDGRYKMLAVADCTGHGIPGAFMSMLGITSLNDIVSSEEISSTTASGILDELRSKINIALRQNEKDGLTFDGMDIAICIIDTETMQMQYAGAYRPLIIIRDGGMIEYFPDKMHIGYEPHKPDPYTNHHIDIRTGDTIYLYTDGLSNQFSHEERGTKFNTERLKKLLRANSDKPFAEQKTIIEDTIMKWRTSNLGEVCPQTDDQLLIGIRI